MSATPAPAFDAEWPGVSVVMPVLDEEQHLRPSVERILAQDYPAAVEVVLALGPSTDATDEIARQLADHDPRIRLVPNPSGRTPAALNAAIRASRHPVVVRVDGHGSLCDGYLRTAVRTLRETGAANVGGVMWAEGVQPFEQAAARAMTTPFGVGAARWHTDGGAGPAQTVYLGSFRRDALEAVGGYDERFVRAQDWELNHRLRQRGGLVWFTPELRVSYRPRPTLTALARQYYDYGRWRRVVSRWHRTIGLRYLAPPVLVLGLVLGVVLGVVGFWPGWLLPAGYLSLLAVATAWSARGLPVRAVAWLPVVFATMHLTWGLGFLLSPRRLVPDREQPGPDNAGPGRRTPATQDGP